MELILPGAPDNPTPLKLVIGARPQASPTPTTEETAMAQVSDAVAETMKQPETIHTALATVASLTGIEGGFTHKEYELIVDASSLGNLEETYEDDGSTIRSAIDKLIQLGQYGHITPEQLACLWQDMIPPVQS